MAMERLRTLFSSTDRLGRSNYIVPKIRLFLYSLVGVFSLIDLIMSSVVLNYLLVNTGTYMKSLPECLFCSGFTIVFLIVVLTVGKHTFLAKVWFELLWLAFVWLLFLGGATTLHRQAPSLLSCGAYFICHGLLVIFIFSYLSVLILLLAWIHIFSACLYQHFRRGKKSIWNSKIEEWEGWDGRIERRDNDKSLWRRSVAIFTGSAFRKSGETTRGDLGRPQTHYDTKNGFLSPTTDSFNIPTNSASPSASPLPQYASPTPGYSSPLAQTPTNSTHYLPPPGVSGRESNPFVIRFDDEEDEHEDDPRRKATLNSQ